MTQNTSPTDPVTRQQPHETDQTPSAARLNAKLQPDPQLAEGPASGSRIAIFAVAIVVVLGAVFYGLNNSALPPPATSTTSQTGASQPTPQANSQTPPASTNGAGVTTGAAPAQPQQSKSAPTGTEIDRSKLPSSSDTGTR